MAWHIVCIICMHVKQLQSTVRYVETDVCCASVLFWSLVSRTCTWICCCATEGTRHVHKFVYRPFNMHMTSRIRSNRRAPSLWGQALRYECMDTYTIQRAAIGNTRISVSASVFSIRCRLFFSILVTTVQSKMVNFCCIVGCTNRSNRERDISFFSIPAILQNQGEHAVELSTTTWEMAD